MVPARYYMENVKRDQLCANPFSTQKNTKDGGCTLQQLQCLQQQMIVLLTTSLQLLTKLLYTLLSKRYVTTGKTRSKI